MPTVKSIPAIENSYFPVSMRLEGIAFKEDLKAGRFLEVEPSYAHKLHVPVVVIETAGKSERRTIKAIRCLYADFGGVGQHWCNVYLYDDDKSYAEPRRFRYKMHRILIDLYRISK